LIGEPGKKGAGLKNLASFFVARRIFIFLAIGPGPSPPNPHSATAPHCDTW
jgi:hypothetical protein